MHTIEFIDPTTTIVRRAGSSTRSTHASARSAQVYVATERLRAAGWSVRGPASFDGFRLPLLLPGEKMCTRLDGARTDERAQGFTATRGGAVLRVDACADGAAEIVLNIGDTDEAVEIVRGVFDVTTATIFAGPDGIDHGTFSGRDEAEILDAYADHLGYRDFAAMASALNLSVEEARAELRVEIVR